MYRPSLKRSEPLKIIKQDHSSTPNINKVVQRVVNLGGDSHMISSKLLDRPNNNNIEKKSNLSPLFAQSHNYPPQVLQLINRQDSQIKKTLGAYKQINWISQGRHIQFWITSQETSVCRQFQDNISFISVGQLKLSSLPSKIRNHYLLAVGIKNYVSIYCLQSFNLRVWDTGIKYTMYNSWDIQHIKFVDGSKLLIYSNPNYIKLVDFNEMNKSAQIKIPFYKKYLPSTFSQSNRFVQNIIYSKNRIFVLFQEIKQKFWFVSTLKKVINPSSEITYNKYRMIQVYSVGQNVIQKMYTITEDDIKRRLKIYNNNWKVQNIKIQNIFLDKQNQNYEGLGIITQNGIFLTLRDMSKVYFTKDPMALTSAVNYQSGYLLMPINFMTNNHQNEGQATQIISSLGLNNLTLTNHSLFWIGSERIDGIHSENLIAQIFLRRDNINECCLFNSKEWAVFTKNSFYSVRQLPVRHFIIAVIYANITQINDYEPLSCQNSAYKAILQRIEQALSPQIFLKNLIEIIISGQKYVVVNQFVLDLIYKQLKGEGGQNYLDWTHELKPKMIKKQIGVTNQILSKIWNIILTLQYKQISSSLAKSKHICDVSIYWQAVHSIYYELINPLFKLQSKQFKDKRQLIQNIFNSLKSLKNFFDIKFKNQLLIRQNRISKISKQSFMSQSTRIQNDNSFQKQNQIYWVQQSVSQFITSKIMSQNIVQVQQKLKKAVNLTINLMTIYFGVTHNEVKLPSFGQILRNRQSLLSLTQYIIENSDFTSLIDIDNQIPELGLKKEIDFKSWVSKMQIQKQGSNINIEHFEQCLKLLNNRYDIHLKMLQLYEDNIIGKKDSLIKKNTLKQRNFLGNTLFPEDEEAYLSDRREYYNSQLDKITDEQKRCLKLAAGLLMAPKISQDISKMIDQIISIAARKHSLYDYFENELRLTGNIQKYTRFQKFKYSQFSRSSNAAKTYHKSRPVERQLFPNP